MNLMTQAVMTAAMLTFSAMAPAQNYPTKPVRLVIPFPSGTSVNDVLGRALARRLSDALGQQVIADNRSGAGGTLGTELVAKAPPDGYTLLVGVTGALSIAPFVYPKLGYDSQRDFIPVAMVALAPYILVVHPSVPAKNVKELIALAKKRPGELRFASAGVGSTPHLCTELFANTTDVKMVHVPYKGGAPAMVDTIAGHTEVLCTSVTNAAPFLKQGRIRAIGVTTLKRLPLLPDLPTVSESGLKGYESGNWFALMAPAKTPREIVGSLHAAALALLRNPVMIKRLNEMAYVPVGSTPEELALHLRSEVERLGKIVRTLNLSAD